MFRKTRLVLAKSYGTMTLEVQTLKVLTLEAPTVEAFWRHCTMGSQRVKFSKIIITEVKIPKHLHVHTKKQ